VHATSVTRTIDFSETFLGLIIVPITATPDTRRRHWHGADGPGLQIAMVDTQVALLVAPLLV
jgi:hypothetical protein